MIAEEDERSVVKPADRHLGGIRTRMSGLVPSAVLLATKELRSHCRKSMVAREGAAPSISGCTPEVMLFRQQA